MKKTFALSCLLLTLTSYQAQATKARVQSLQGAAHLVDSQSIFTYPADILQLGSYVGFEFGPTASGNTEPKAEGGLFRKNADNSVYGFYLGHHSVISAARSATGVPGQSNPIQAFYGKDNWAATVAVSQSDTKTTGAKETSLSLGYGQTLADLSWGVTADLVSNAEAKDTPGNDKFTGAPSLIASVRSLGQTYWHGSLMYGALKFEDGATSASNDIKPMGLQVGWVDRGLSNTTTDLYYGINLNYASVESGGKKVTTMSLPVVLGLEHNVNSWSVLRASISQNALFGSTKDESQTPPADAADSIANNTKISAGLGLKYGSLQLDGVLAVANSGNINGNQVLANAGLIYNF